MTVGGGICANCHNVRSLDELTAFWPVGVPTGVRYVCRPSPSTFQPTACFARVVGTDAVHEVLDAPTFQRSLEAARDVVGASARLARHGPQRGADLRGYATVASA